MIQTHSGGWSAGGQWEDIVSVHCATTPEVLIKLKLQEKQKLCSHFRRPQRPRSQQLGEFHITSVPQALGGSDPNEHSLPACRARTGRNDLIATATAHWGQFHGRYLFSGLDAERIFSSPAVSMETPATLLANPLPTSCFSDQYWSPAPRRLPTEDGGSARARVKPGAWGVVTEGVGGVGVLLLPCELTQPGSSL